MPGFFVERTDDAESARGPERRSLRDSNTSEIGGKAEFAGARSSNIADDASRPFTARASVQRSKAECALPRSAYWPAGIVTTRT
jgi:hypothetical protein